jgi:hypothetical protein
MGTTLREYPHLPLLTFEQCMAVFKLAKISFNMLSALLGLSRQSVYLWRKGRSPHELNLDRVSTLAYRALACLRDRTLPQGKRAKIEVVRGALDAIDLKARQPQDLLPRNWLPTE